MLSGLAHDPLHRDIFTPLQLGGTVCIPDQQGHRIAGPIESVDEAEAESP